MPDRIAEAPWLEYLLESIYQGQWKTLQLMHWLGLVGSIDGQPAWPWRSRLSGQDLLIDLSQARALLISIAITACLVAWGLFAVYWRQIRWPFLAALQLAVFFTPWPTASVWVVPANPSSFHSPSVPWSDEAITAGAQHYARHCVQCHGEKGNGQGPAAALQPVWPPNFVGPLLWRSADGDLFAHVRYGMRSRQGQLTMPAFAHDLTVDETWEVLHYLRAKAAGEVLEITGEWMQPVPIPEMRLDCAAAEKNSVGDWRGQHLMMVTGPVDNLLPDPRLVTLWLPPTGVDVTAIPPQVDCIISSASGARVALATITGSDTEEQHVQLLADRKGWLRARNNAAASGWSESSLICSTPVPDSTVVSQVKVDGLERLLRLIDTSPVRFVKGGRIH